MHVVNRKKNMTQKCLRFSFLKFYNLERKSVYYLRLFDMNEMKVSYTLEEGKPDFSLP